MSLSLLSADYDLSEKKASMETSRSFVISILFEAYKSGNELQVVEFEEKLKNIDNEINQLMK